MAKNLMAAVAKLLGVELGEEFVIENADRKENVVLAMDGFHVIQPNNVAGIDNGKLLSKVLQGLYEAKKLPWEPKKHECYWTMCFESDGKPFANRLVWNGDSIDFGKKALNMVYRTREEAEAHMAEDYERLTGKPLDSSWAATESLDSHCVNIKSLNSLNSLSGRRNLE